MEKVPRFFTPPERSYFLFGARGTGKSTWVRDWYEDALWVDLLWPATYRRYETDPDHLDEVVRGNPERTHVVLDEIQKVPALLDVVHAILEEPAPPLFVLTGSSARKLKRSGVDLLAGRALLRTMHPFMAAELGDLFDLDEALLTGLVPVVVDSDDPTDVLQSYASLYLREEVQAEGLVRNLAGFARFLEAVSFSHASVLNVSNIARDCHVGRRSVQSYVDILEDLLLAHRLPVFTRRAQRAMTVHPKLFLFDAGVYRSLRPAGPLDRPEEIDGAALEGLIAQHLVAWNGYGGGRSELAHWRTRGGAEVDLVVYGPDGFWAIEVKNSRDVRPQDLRGLRTFGEDFPEAQRLLLYRGADRFERNGVLCIPCEEFLRQLRPGQPVW
jgi:uncharacterized protein